MEFVITNEVLNGILQAGLRPKNLQTHMRRFEAFAERGWKNHTFIVKDSCRVTNQRILPIEAIRNFPQQHNFSGIAGFIPAAGSSTRFINPLFELFSDKDKERLTTDWVLPASFSQNGDRPSFNKLLRTPKALFPCVREGDTFLDMKCREHQAIHGLDSLILVSPWKFSERFRRSALKTLGKREKLDCFEQGPELSTIRLDRDGQPVKDGGSKISAVPSGHGALLELFPRVRQRYPSTEALFIKNIDNLVGCGEEAVVATRSFLSFYKHLLTKIKSIRAALQQGQRVQAAQFALEVSSLLPLRKLTEQERASLNEIDEREFPLWNLQFALFQMPVGMVQTTSLPSLYARPLNIMGQVPNSGKDKGGVPVIVESPVGDLAICLELPHMLEKERDHFFADPRKATHFNPVFAVVEAVQDLTTYQLDKHPYWIFAEKIWKGRSVYYHESLLYELIGNSQMANLVFCEVPRSVFNPNKTLDDTKNRRLADWV